MLVRTTALILVVATFLHAQYQNAGSAEFVFLRNFQAARPAGMVGAGASLEGGLQTLGLNPAGIARTPSPWLEISARRQDQAYQSGILGAAYPFLNGNIAGQLAYLDAGDPITGLDEYNAATGKTMSPSSWMLSTSYAEPLGKRLSWGATFRWVREDLDVDGSVANGLSMDLGIILQPGARRFTYGLSIVNLGTKLTGHTRNESDFGDMPLSVTGSVRTLLTGDGATSLLVDVQKPIDNYAQLRVGLEQRVFEGLTIRGGLRSDQREILDFVDGTLMGESVSDHPASMALRASAGATIAVSNWSIDYALQAWGPLGYVHFLTFSMNLGRLPKEVSSQ
jgi:hypothetical protein